MPRTVAPALPQASGPTPLQPPGPISGGLRPLPRRRRRRTHPHPHPHPPGQQGYAGYTWRVTVTSSTWYLRAGRGGGVVVGAWVWNAGPGAGRGIMEGLGWWRGGDVRLLCHSRKEAWGRHGGESREEECFFGGGAVTYSIKVACSLLVTEPLSVYPSPNLAISTYVGPAGVSCRRRQTGVQQASSRRHAPGRAGGVDQASSRRHAPRRAGGVDSREGRQQASCATAMVACTPLPLPFAPALPTVAPAAKLQDALHVAKGEGRQAGKVAGGLRGVGVRGGMKCMRSWRRWCCVSGEGGGASVLQG